MTSIKSYTDLQQSKKLAEILPLESADMSWVSNGLGKPFARTIPIKNDPEELCGCWSLAALLDVLPERYTELIKEGGMYRIIIKDSYMTCLFGNPIDACYEMIIRLHELKLL